MKITRFLPIPLVALGLVATSASAHDNGKTMLLTGKALGPPTQIDAGAPGPSAGDQQIITMDVFQGAKRLGTSHVVCVTVRTDMAQCDSVTTLPGGQIATSGVVTSAEEETSPFVQGITGGTGIYRTAQGQLTVSEAGPQPAVLTFQFA